MDDNTKELLILIVTSGTTVLVTWLKMRSPRRSGDNDTDERETP